MKDMRDMSEVILDLIYRGLLRIPLSRGGSKTRKKKKKKTSRSRVEGE